MASSHNIDIVRNVYEALGRDDVEAAIAAIDPAVEIYDHDIPDAGEYRGLDGLAAWRADWERSWESWRWEPEEFIDAGDRVVAILRVHARGRESGVEVERLDGAVWTLRDGKGVRVDYYGSSEEALAAVAIRG